MSKRILLISNMYPSDQDPRFGVFVKNKVKNLKASGIEISDLIVIRGMQSGIYNKLSSYLTFYLSILFLPFRKRFDIIYVHYPLFALIPLIIIKPFLSKSRLILNFHGNDLLGTGKVNKILGKLYPLILSEADSFVVPSDFFRKKLSSIHQISENKIFVYPSGGIDVSVFFANNYSTSDRTRIGFVGRLVEMKGWKVFLDGIKKLEEGSGKVFDIVMVINYMNNRSAFENMLKDLMIKSDIKIVEECNQQELRSYFQWMDVFCFPTLYEESLGLVAVESMACGTPVIGSKIGALPEYIIENKTGYLFEANNGEALFKSLKEYIDLSVNSKKELFENCIAKAGEYEKNQVTKKIIHELRLS